MNTAIAITAIIATVMVISITVTALQQTAEAKRKTANRYPHPDGDVTVLGPEIFASSDATVICWKGVNYVRQDTKENNA